MTNLEFSHEFDVLINSSAYSKPFGIANSPVEFDEYEKSILLTEAQEQVVRGLYTGTLTGKSLEETEELRRSLDSLIKTEQVNHPYLVLGKKQTIDSRSNLYLLLPDVWFITYEWGTIDSCNDTIQIIPMKQDDWHRCKNNPFKGPTKRKAVRLDAGSNIVEVISDIPLVSYNYRYLSKPTPIVLTDLEAPLEIDSVSKETECKLNTALHRTILEVAVQLGLRRISNTKTN